MPKLAKQEQEIHISKAADESEWCIYSTDPTWTRFFRKLADKIGGREVQHQGGTKIFLPATELQFVAKRHLRLSAEEQARRRDRLQASPKCAHPLA
jgi:hypothetical protein